MTTKRLIEETFPLRQTSIDAVHEKNVRHGHISTLHIWPARRPLAAARAALLAVLLPDPGTEDAREALGRRIGGTVVTDRKTGKNITEGGVLHWTGDKEKQRGIEMDKVLTELRAEILQANGGEAPKVLDMFAGGGAIPLEAMRLGCDVTAVDYNPVAWFLLKCTLDYPHRLAGKKWKLPSITSTALPAATMVNKDSETGAFTGMTDDHGDLAAHVRFWGEWVLARARADLQDYYPTLPLDPARPEGPDNPACATVAYLWARTVPHPDPQKNGLQVPLLKTLWLCKKAEDATETEDDAGVARRKAREKKRALRMLYNTRENRFDFEVFTPLDDNEVGVGTMGEGGVTCPPTISSEDGAFLTTQYIQRCGKEGKMGAVCTAVVIGIPSNKPNSKMPPRKEYRRPTSVEIEAVEIASRSLPQIAKEIPFGLPTEHIPYNPRRVGVQLYGMETYAELFTHRQLLSLCTIVKNIRTAKDAVLDFYGKTDQEAELLSEAIAAYLYTILSKIADRNSTLCSWTIDYEKIRNTFVRFALPMTWDFCESVPINDSTGGWEGGIAWAVKAVEQMCLAANGYDIRIINDSAINPIGEECVDVIVTDPPYYDAIPYSDIANFFYVWLRRVVAGSYGAVFNADLPSNTGELTADRMHKQLKNPRTFEMYEQGMAKAFRAACYALKPNGRLVIVFAHKEPTAWETLVTAMIQAGFVITGSWPVDTERGSRSNAIGTAALSSSVWLVCRKRAANAGRGNLARVRKEMQERITERLRYFWDNGIKGPDLLWAAIGPGLESYSQYETVSSMSGKPFEVRDFIAEVRRLTTDFALGQIIEGGTEGLDEITRYALMHQQNFGMGPAPVGECILLAGAYGLDLGTLTDARGILMKAKAKAKRATTEDDAVGDDPQETGSGGSGNELRLKRWEERKHDSLGEAHPAYGLPVIDMLHRLLREWDGTDLRGVEEYLSRNGLAHNELFWRVAQAFAELPSTPDRNRIDTLIKNYKGREIAYVAPLNRDEPKAPRPVTLSLNYEEETTP